MTKEGELVQDYLDKKSELFRLASTHSLPRIIGLSETLEKMTLAKHIQFFRDRLHGRPPRLADIYSIYRHFVYQVIIHTIVAALAGPNRHFQLLVYACGGGIRYHIADYAEKIKMVAV
jgi:hypothetical protein